ncbi:MAG: glycosyltransferase family 2 protein [Bacteroidetes bacterium]|uniref:Glycosyltransferase family 2 protein n=1 Tax=Candidatus Merdivivens pullicola TaxID=2840872 RepID=A0A9D9IIA9_9BACT|nr:glycosyltransferase family 2 protein [Candidatus Merdivivens pullicola]
MNVFAVIVTYNAMRWAGKSISSLYRSTCCPYRIIVIDNSSSDGTPEYVNATFPDVELIRMDSNIGFAASARVGVDKAVGSGADAVLLMHHDVWLAPDALEVLEGNCTDDSLLVPVYMNGPGSDYETSFRSVIRHSGRLRKTLPGSAGGRSCYKIPVRNVPYGCWFIPVPLINEIGFLNPLFFCSGASEEYLARMRCRSKKAFVVTGAKIFHDRDSYGDRTLYDTSLIYRDLLLIECDPGKTKTGRVVSRALLLAGLVRKSLHYRVNLLPFYFKDRRRIKGKNTIIN